MVVVFEATAAFLPQEEEATVDVVGAWSLKNSKFVAIFS
jgi:hypothetical protein